MGGGYRWVGPTGGWGLQVGGGYRWVGPTGGWSLQVGRSCRGINHVPPSPRHDLKDRDAKLHKLGSELRSRAGETERLQKMVGQHQRAQDRLRQEAEYRMFTLRVRTTPPLHLLLLKDPAHNVPRVPWLP